MLWRIPRRERPCYLSELGKINITVIATNPVPSPGTMSVGRRESGMHTTVVSDIRLEVEGSVFLSFFLSFSLKYVQGYNKFQTEIALTKKQKKEVESAKPVEEKVFVKMTVPELKDTLKNKFDVTPKSSARKAELVEMAMAEFRKCGMPATPTTSSKPPTVQSRVPSQPLSRAPQPSLSSHQSFAAQLSSLSPISSVPNSNATLANNTNDSLVVENNSMLVEEPSTPLIDPSASKSIVKIAMKAKK
jgi:hypothetical protein